MRVAIIISRITRTVRNNNTASNNSQRQPHIDCNAHFSCVGPFNGHDPTREAPEGRKDDHDMVEFNIR